jgi:hypothetical protein
MALYQTRSMPLARGRSGRNSDATGSDLIGRGEERFGVLRSLFSLSSDARVMGAAYTSELRFFLAQLLRLAYTRNMEACRPPSLVSQYILTNRGTSGLGIM